MRKILLISASVCLIAFLAFVILQNHTTEKHLTPQEVANLAKKTQLHSFANGKELEKMFGSLEAMDLNQLSDVLSKIQFEGNPSQTTDLRLAVLTAASMRISEKIILDYTVKPRGLPEAKETIGKIFAPHPFLLNRLIFEAEAEAKKAKAKAEELEGEEKGKHLKKAAHLFLLTGHCNFIMYEFKKDKETQERIYQSPSGVGIITNQPTEADKEKIIEII